MIDDFGTLAAIPLKRISDAPERVNGWAGNHDPCHLGMLTPLKLNKLMKIPVILRLTLHKVSLC